MPGRERLKTKPRRAEQQSDFWYNAIMNIVPPSLPLQARNSLRSRPRAGVFLKAAMLVVVVLFAARVAAWATDLAPSLTVPKEQGRIEVYLFRGDGCSRCEEEKRFLSGLAHGHSDLDVRVFEVLHDSKNLNMLIALMNAHGRQASGVPVTFIGDGVFEGFSKPVQAAMERAIKECRERSCADPAAVLKGREYAAGHGAPGPDGGPGRSNGPAVRPPAFRQVSTCAVYRSRCSPLPSRDWTASIPAPSSCCCRFWGS